MKDLLQVIDRIERQFRESATLKTLPNGLHLIVEQDPKAPSLFKGDLWVDFGSKDEKPEHEGVAHFIEHIGFNGTNKYPSKAVVEEAGKKLGQQLNANTNGYRIMFPFKGLDTDLERTIDIISQLAFAQTFPESSLDHEKKVVINEMRMYRSNPYTIINEWITGNFTRGFPLSHPILGNETTVNALRIEDLINYRDSFMHPARGYLTLVGDLNTQELKAVEDLVSEFKKGPEIQETEVPEETQITEREVHTQSFSGINRAQIRYLFRTPKVDHENNTSLSLASNVLGGGTDSRLYRALREDNGLTYSVSVDNSTDEYSGIFSISFDVAPEEVPKAIQLVDAELRKLPDKGMEQKHFERYLRQTRIGILSDSYGAGQAADYLFATHKRGFNHLDRARGLVSLNKQELQRVSAQYLQPKQSMLFIALPQ